MVMGLPDKIDGSVRETVQHIDKLRMILFRLLHPARGDREVHLELAVGSLELLRISQKSFSSREITVFRHISEEMLVHLIVKIPAVKSACVLVYAVGTQSVRLMNFKAQGYWQHKQRIRGLIYNTACCHGEEKIGGLGKVKNYL